MNKESFSYILIIALIAGALYYNNLIQSPIISSLNYIKTSYHDATKYISDSIDKHIFQAAHIQELNTELEKYENDHIVMRQLANEIEELYRENDSTLKLNTKVVLVRAISYEKFGNTDRIWMDIPEYNSSKIYGLTYKEVVAGIVISKNNRALGLLNRDIQSAYSVYVGEGLAPGIAHGNNEEHIVVKFIPSWFDIKKGDEVITSGLDNIFTKGLKVGKVISVTSAQGYKNAIIDQYYKDVEPGYFHMIRSVR